ncbi:ABC transporter permease [Granulicella rosea]|nr:FtsX-like permease family protein [Granulicella rosea]
MASLSYRTAARIAAREMRSSRGKFFFVILSVAIGVAALTGVRGFSSSFRGTLLTRARSIMAADLSARMQGEPTPEEAKGLAAIQAEGVEVTLVTEQLSMASAVKTMDPLLVSVKAVDAAKYPFYGEVDLEPAAKLTDVLQGDNVAVADDLLVRLKLQRGDQIRIGNTSFRIASVVTNEPDRLSGSFAAGPRVLMSRTALESTGLLAPGNHATERYLFKVPAPKNGSPISDDAVAELKTRLVALLPEAQVIDYRETNPALTQGLDQATSLLSLMSLVALVLGAVGVAMAMRAHLAQRLDTIAIMKSLGAQSGQIVKIYLLQTLLLGTLGGLIGVVMGVGVQMAFPYLLKNLINVAPDLHIDPRAIAAGLGAGILTTLLFTLPPLLDIRDVRPILILRRAMDEEDGPFLAGLAKKIWDSIAQIVAFAFILLGLTLIALRVSDSPVVGKWFAVGLAGVLGVLLAASFVVLRTLRFFLSRTRLHLPSAVRHGLANLYRPGNPSAALLAALGMGVMQIMMVFLMQHAVVTSLAITSRPNLPNVFLVDIAHDEIDGMRKLLAASPEITAPPELLPVATSRIAAVDGVPASELKLKNFPKRMLQTVQLTWAAAPPPGTTIAKGAWWTDAQAADGAAHPLVAVAERPAERLGLHVGSTVSFAAQDREFTATVAAITKSDGQHAFSRAEFYLPEKTLAGLPVVWYGGVHADPAKVALLQRALYAAYPTVTVINVAQALETIRSVVIQIIYVVQFLAAFSIFAGVVILASSIAGTRYRRMREVVVLKTLGATRTRIATVFSIEFAVLGLVAGVVGIFFADVIVHFLLKSLSVPDGVEWGLSFAGLLLTAVLTVGTGWLASHRILGQKPLEVLREE